MDPGIIAKLEAAIANGDVIIMTRAKADRLEEVAEISGDDVKDLRDMIRIYRGVAGLGVLAGIVRSALLLAAMLAALVLYLRGKMPLNDLLKGIGVG